MIRTSLVIIGTLLGLVLLGAAWAEAKPRRGYQRHEAVCLAGEIAVCAQPVSRHKPIAVRWYRPAGAEAWRIAFDIASGLDARSAPVCECTRKAQAGAVTLTCTCTGARP